jgi:hypothetical protein
MRIDAEQVRVSAGGYHLDLELHIENESRGKLYEELGLTIIRAVQKVDSRGKGVEKDEDTAGPDGDTAAGERGD